MKTDADFNNGKWIESYYKLGRGKQKQLCPLNNDNTSGHNFWKEDFYHPVEVFQYEAKVCWLVDSTLWLNTNKNSITVRLKAERKGLALLLDKVESKLRVLVASTLNRSCIMCFYVESPLNYLFLLLNPR